MEFGALLLSGSSDCSIALNKHQTGNSGEPGAATLGADLLAAIIQFARRISLLGVSDCGLHRHRRLRLRQSGSVQDSPSAPHTMRMEGQQNPYRTTLYKATGADGDRRASRQSIAETQNTD
jgi:hypothetical protein